MYERILLAYDGTLEGRTALREGALLASQCGAEVFLLAIATIAPALMMAEAAHAGVVAQVLEKQEPVFEGGLARLRELGLHPTGKLVAGEPVQEIAACALAFKADLVVVGHRRQTLIERWWSGRSGAYLADHVGCSLLVARNPTKLSLVPTSPGA